MGKQTAKQFCPGDLFGESGVAGTASFDIFWKAYPRHSAIYKAKAKWKEIKPDENLLAVILAAIAQQRKTKQWKDGIIPHAATWLHQQRWEDEVSLPVGMPENPTDRLLRLAIEERARWGSEK